MSLIAYTSILHAERTGIQLAAEHQATEQLLSESKLPYVLLRNSWYLELYLAQIPRYLAHGAILGCSGEGRVSAATRGNALAPEVTSGATTGNTNTPARKQRRAVMTKVAWESANVLNNRSTAVSFS